MELQKKSDSIFYLSETKTRGKQKISLLIAIFLLCNATKAISSQFIVLPWIALPEQSAIVASIKKDLMKSQQIFAKKIFRNGISLLEYNKKFNKEVIPINLQALAKTTVLEDKQLSKEPIIFVAPFLCKIADRWMIAITQSEALSSSFLQMQQTSLQQKDILAEKTSRSDLLANLLANKWQDMKSDNREQSSTLQIGLRSARVYNRFDQGPEQCIEMLFREQLATKGFRVLTRLGEENEKAVREHILKLETRPARSTLEMVLHLEDMAKQNTFPIEINFFLSTLNGVFGNAITSGIARKSTLTVGNGGHIDLALPNEIEDFLIAEKKAMLRSDSPSIVKVYRAWVYLDRGRAWGLKMNDRLVVSTNQKDIKGHVVGFFGPELGIKNPNGGEIHDGAIVFVRKGQKKVEIGQQFEFDPRSFPTSWPPKPGI